MDSIPQILNKLWEDNFFMKWRDQSSVTEHLSKKGINPRSATLGMALKRAAFLTRRETQGKFEYIQKKPAVAKKISIVEDELFETSLLKKFGSSFEHEIDDLRLNFNKSGNCTAFILRKILEKLIYKVFAKNKIESKLDDPGAPGNLVGLEKMINIATSEKIDGFPVLTNKTAKEIRGIKFLADTSAHNPLTEVDMKTIIPQMPFIITAYKELLARV